MTAISTIGLILVLTYLILGFDDFIWDILTIKKKRAYNKRKINMDEMEACAPKLLAVAIAAWHEGNVLGDVVSNFILSTHYPRSMYHVFLGVYPNDAETCGVAYQLAGIFPNVHVVINCKDGPTSKAQNINYMMTQIKEFEGERGWRFAGLTIHDSEDIVHAYELKVTNYLLDFHDALQFPVFPLQEMPRLKNFFKNLTVGTYADEFAENHFTTMVNRCESGAFVPSAGTGFALSRRVIDRFEGEEILPSNSLTEDYRLSLTLCQMGIPMHYVLERVRRLRSDGKVVWDYISTRSRFPGTFKTAVRQKTRWIFGITMQSLSVKDIFAPNEMGFVARYTMYKDIKAKVGNLMTMIGNPVFLYFILSYFLPLPPVFPIGSLSWYLSFLMTAMMLERQVLRAIAIRSIYGARSMFIACFCPPIISIRLVWGNIINMVATIKAWRRFFFGIPTPKVPKEKRTAQAAQVTSPAPQKHAWDKTEHEFLHKDILKRFHRNLGDVLIEKRYVNPERVKEALDIAKLTGVPLGSALMKMQAITEEQLLYALSEIMHIPYLEGAYLSALRLTNFAQTFERRQLVKLCVAPVLRTEDGYVFAFCEETPLNAQTILARQYGITVHAAFATNAMIREIIACIYRKKPLVVRPSLIYDLYNAGKIDSEQLILAFAYCKRAGCTEAEAALKMGIIAHLDNAPSVEEAFLETLQVG